MSNCVTTVDCWQIE